ncbi:MAG: tetratricopeptide repeat protein [Oligoflexia bacterium]|nr:tetratricopeptide repeat protein [Oligoflexia bacterium]
MQKITAALAGLSLVSGAIPSLANEPGLKTRSAVSSPLLSAESEQKIRDGINSLQILIHRAHPGPQMDALLMTRAKLELSLAQKMLLLPKASVTNSRISRLLESSIKDAMTVAASPASAKNARLRSNAYYFAGEAAIYLNRNAQANQWFKQAIEINPSGSETPLMAFFIAEDYFDHQDYDQARSYYSRYLERLEPRIKRLAIYKIAWCWLKQEKVDEAEKSLMYLVRHFPKEEVSKDAIRDLGFVLSRFRSEDQALNLATELFPTEKDEAKFLRIIETNYEQQGKASARSKVFKRLVDLTTDPVEKIELYLGLLNMVRKDFASTPHYLIFTEIRSTLETNDIGPGSKQIAPLQRVLDEETQKLVRAYIDTYSGKQKNLEKIPRDKLVGTMKDLFGFYSAYFPKSEFVPVIMRIWIDVCQDSKDWACIDNINKHLTDDSASTVALREKAALAEIVAFEALAKENRGRYRPRLMESLNAFTKNYPKSSLWLATTKRSVDLLLEDKRYDDAIPVLDKILAHEPNEENFYRSQWARFQAEQYGEVGNRGKDPKFASIKKSTRLQTLQREALLKIAETARNKNDTKTYTESIRQFISSGADAGKAKIARADLLRFDIEKGAYPAADEEILKVAPNDRVSPDFHDSLETLVSYHLKRGEFKQADQLLAGVKAPNSSVHFESILAKLGSGGTIRRSDTQGLSSSQQSYLMTTLCLLQPETLFDWFKATPPQTKEERTLLLLALRLRHDNWNFTPSPEEKAWLKDTLPESTKSYPTTALEKRLASLHYPEAGATGPKAEKALQLVVQQTQEIRGQISDEIKGKPAEVQLRIFQAARANEEKVAQLILASPPPADLTLEQRDQYEAALKKAAGEFTAQGQEFGKLETSTKNALNEIQEKEKERILPPVSMDKWPWPNGGDKLLVDSVKSQNAMGAWILLELHRKDWFSGDDQKYYLCRSGVLLGSNGGETMRRYLYDELTTAEQEDVIKKWKEVAR